jgi:capsular polysaccharide biosynthesis protein
LEDISLEESRELSISELLYIIIKKWRWILSLMIIFAISMTGLALLSNARLSITETEIATRQEALAKTNEDIKSLATQITNNQKTLDTRKASLKQSIFLNINPEAQGTSEALIRINLVPDNTGSAQEKQLVLTSLGVNYQQATTNDNFANYINKNLDTSYTKAALNEVITVGTNESGELSIKAVHDNPEGASSMVLAVIEYLESYAQSNMQMLQPHTLELVNKNETVVANPAIASQRKAAVDAIIKLEGEIANAENEIKSIVVADLEAGKLKSVPQNAILGIFLGIFFGAVLAFLPMVLNNRIRDERDVENRLGLYLIGTVRREEQ